MERIYRRPKTPEIARIRPPFGFERNDPVATKAGSVFDFQLSNLDETDSRSTWKLNDTASTLMPAEPRGETQKHESEQVRCGFFPCKMSR